MTLLEIAVNGFIVVGLFLSGWFLLVQMVKWYVHREIDRADRDETTD